MPRSILQLQQAIARTAQALQTMQSRGLEYSPEYATTSAFLLQLKQEMCQREAKGGTEEQRRQGGWALVAGNLAQGLHNAELRVERTRTALERLQRDLQYQEADVSDRRAKLLDAQRRAGLLPESDEQRAARMLGVEP